MSKVFIAGGDSFTFGSELPDCTETVYSKMTWSALLAKHMNLDYECVAKPGSGNNAIMRLVIEAVENNPGTAFVAVMWSWPGRFEIKVNDEIKKNALNKVFPEKDIAGNWVNISPWNSLSFDDRIKLMPAKDDPYFVKNYKYQCDLEKQIGLNSLAETYFSLASNDHFLYSTALAIFTLQCYLEKKEIDYIFAATTDHLLEIFDKDDIPFTKMIDRTKWLNLDKGMYQWALENEYEISSMNHPVAKAHEDWINVYYKD